MVVVKILNNNAVIVKEDDYEKIILSKGIGFGTYIGQRIRPSKKSKIFVVFNKPWILKLIQEIPIDCFKIADDILSVYQSKAKVKLRDSLNIDLANCIYNIIQFSDNPSINPTNGLLNEIKSFYQLEYDIVSDFVNDINKKFKVKITEDNVGFIALVLINGLQNNSELLKKLLDIYKNIEKVVVSNIKSNINQKSFEYNRFLVHIKYFSLKLLNPKRIKTKTKKEDQDFFNIIKNTAQEAYQISIKVKQLIEHYQYYMNEDELIYLTLHIKRIIQTSF